MPSSRRSNGSCSDSDAVLIDQDDVSNYNPGQILPEKPETIEQIRNWLQPTSYGIAGGEYRKHLASYEAGTGQSLTSSQTYQTWLHGGDDESGLLWLKGIPGSGKSVMAAKLIREIAESHPGSPVLFFFSPNHRCQSRDQGAFVRLDGPGARIQPSSAITAKDLRGNTSPRG
jgi:hypothetical protein